MNTRITKEDWVHIALASLHNAVIYCLDGKRLMKVKETCTPELIINEGVEVVCDDAFRGNTKVTKVILPSTLKVIGKSAFEDCVNLKYVFIPEGVTEIPRDCFKGCTSLEEVVMPDGISVIGRNAFEGCTSLKTLHFPSQLRTIDDFAFMHSGLESFCPTLAEDVKCKIFEKAFAFCENLNTVTLTPGVQLAGEMSFLCCTNLEEVAFTEECQGLPGAVATMLVGCDNLKKITIPDSEFGTNYNFNSKDWDTAEYEHCDYNHLVLKQIGKENIVNVVRNYVESYYAGKNPMLIWFKSNEDIDKVRQAIREVQGCCEVNQHPLYGYEHFIDNDGKVKQIADHPELTNKFIYPGRYDENVRFFLYHRYTEQLHGDHIAYVKELAEKTTKPLVLLVNDYSKEDRPEFTPVGFEQYGIIKRVKNA